MEDHDNACFKKMKHNRLEIFGEALVHFEIIYTIFGSKETTLLTH